MANCSFVSWTLNFPGTAEALCARSKLALFSGFRSRVPASADFVLAEVGPTFVEVRSLPFC